ncbi:MAG TPA: FAD-dependent monooxygenase [Mycobacteriales bacterium]|nr:FAD-dependent monooxygenase [Mycobacteriales bacterium]
MFDHLPGDSTTVLIVGAGPAGLVLGNLLRAEGIDCLILERQSREVVERRARAGFLAANSVRILQENGLAAGLLKHGRHHDTCLFRSDQMQFELKYSGLGRGETHTVYPQQDLVRDLTVEFVRRGGDVRFETTVLAVNDVDSDRPWITCRGADGHVHRCDGRYVAGCDGQHGISRQAMPDRAVRRSWRDHGVSWLAILAEAPQSMAAVAYAIHDRGFAGHMARSPSATRYYLQCPKGDEPERWSDRRIWDELHLREVLAKALTAGLKRDDERPLARYSAECMPRIWRAQEFSHWMIDLLHGPSGSGEEALFLRALQRARLKSLQSSRSHQDFFAENYVGI